VSLSRTRGRSLSLLLGLALLALLVAPAAMAAGRKGTNGEGAEPVFRSLSYGPSPAELLDVYASGVPHSTVVVLVHGGGWRKQGDLSRLESESLSLQRAGLTVFDINYDQDGGGVRAFPLEPNDVLEATHWAISHAASFNGNPAKVVLIGGSAGGHLVSLAAEQLAVSDPGVVKGVISLSGPMNFISLWPQIENGTLAISGDNFRISVEMALGFRGTHQFPRAFAEQWSPALHVPRRDCPTWLIINSASEAIPLSQAEEMQGALEQADCESTLRVVPGSEHSFAYWTHVRGEIGRFIAGL
jgi:acetyl esterase/lipase